MLLKGAYASKFETGWEPWVFMEQNGLPRYSWKFVESGVKTPKINQIIQVNIQPNHNLHSLKSYLYHIARNDRWFAHFHIQSGGSKRIWTLIYSWTTSFSGGGSRSTRREPPTMGKQLVSFITCGCKSSAPFFVIYKAGHEPTPYWW
jgi:hypothetical protein